MALSVFSMEKCRLREAELFGLLAVVEQDEARSLGSGERRSVFVASRALTRMVLSAEWPDAVAPRDWKVERTSLGKLVVLGPPCTGMDISLSHTDRIIAVAVSGSHAVGVDIEPTGQDDADELAWASVLSPSERERLIAVPGSPRRHRRRLGLPREPSPLVPPGTLGGPPNRTGWRSWPPAPGVMGLGPTAVWNALGPSPLRLTSDQEIVEGGFQHAGVGGVSRLDQDMDRLPGVALQVELPGGPGGIVVDRLA